MSSKVEQYLEFQQELLAHKLRIMKLESDVQERDTKITYVETKLELQERVNSILKAKIAQLEGQVQRLQEAINYSDSE